MKTLIAKLGQAASTHGVPATSARWALASLSLAMLLSSLGTSIANVALPTLVETFHASFQAVQWVLLIYLLTITSLIVSAGRLGDLIGRRRLMLVGIALFTAASVLCGLASELWLLICARAVQGLGAAIMMALTMALVSEAVPKEKTGSAMGLLGTMSAIGTALGPSLGGLLIAGLGWRSIFLINLPLGLLALLLAWRYLPEDRPALTTNLPRFDKPGTVLLALTLITYALAMTLGRGSFGAVNLACLIAATVGAGLFVLIESKAVSPLIRLQTFKNPLLSAGFASNILVATVMMATLVVGPFYLAGALELATAQVGLVMSAGPIVSALVGVPAGRLVDRFGTQFISIFGLVGMAIGTAILPMVPTSFGALGYIAPLVIITAHYALFQAANNTAVMVNIRPEERGVVSGMLNLSRNLGLITGASAMGAVFAFGAAAVRITSSHPQAVTAGMHITFTLAAALIVIALVITLIGQVRARSVHS